METRRKTRARAAQEHDFFLKLPSELRRMIFDYFVDEEDKLWLASLVCLCKSLMTDVESALYRKVAVSTCKYTSILCRAVVKRRHRAISVRDLIVSVRGGTSIRQPLKSAFHVLSNLSGLELTVDDMSIYKLLLDVPFRLRRFVAGGERFPPCFEDILAHQPSIETLSLLFAKNTPGRPDRCISRPDILPNLRTLTGLTTRYPALSYIQYPYSVKELKVAMATHADIEHASSMFGRTLVKLTALRRTERDCVETCYWPTSVLRDAHFPKLTTLEVTDLFGPHADIPYTMDTAHIESLRAACPALKSLIWSVGEDVLQELHWGWDWDSLDLLDPADTDLTIMEDYARRLFEALPTLESVSFVDVEQEPGWKYSRYGEIFARAQDKSIQGPEYALVEYP